MGGLSSSDRLKGPRLEMEITNALLDRDFDAEHVGGAWDGGIDIEVSLFGELRTVQCANWGQRTFSFSKLFEKLRRAQIAILKLEGFKHPLVIVPLPSWLDHLTWDRPGADHSKRKLRAFLTLRGLSKRDIDIACEL
jgi:hypothetical protein